MGYIFFNCLLEIYRSEKKWYFYWNYPFLSTRMLWYDSIVEDIGHRTSRNQVTATLRHHVLWIALILLCGM